MRRRPRPLTVAAVAAVAVVASGCTSTPAAVNPTNATARVTSAGSPPVTAPPTAAPTGVIVVATGAAASPTGTLLFVVVRNAGDTAASNVRVDAIAASSNGGAALQGTAAIPNLAARESQAAAITLAVPSGDSLGAITATVHVAGASTYTNPLTAADARFIDDPISPSISVSVAGATAVANAVVVAICWTGSRIVGGAIRQHVAVATGGPRTVTMQAALTATPGSCSGYARPG